MPELYTEDRGSVRWIVLDRPESRNGLTLGIVESLTGLLREANADPAVRVVVLYGANGSFCSGLDLKAALGVAADPAAAKAGMALFHNLVRALRGVMKPTIAAIDGAAAGFGADLALGCDLRWASERARLGERFVRIGLMSDGGGTHYLPRLVGLAKAYELLYEGRMVEPAELVSLGLVNRMVPAEGFADAVQAYAAGLAGGAPLAFARTKAAVQAGYGDIEANLAAEAEGQLALLQSADFAEGVQAFFMKRDPNFAGK